MNNQAFSKRFRSGTTSIFMLYTLAVDDSFLEIFQSASSFFFSRTRRVSSIQSICPEAVLKSSTADRGLERFIIMNRLTVL